MLLFPILSIIAQFGEVSNDWGWQFIFGLVTEGVGIIVTYLLIESWLRNQEAKRIQEAKDVEERRFKPVRDNIVASVLDAVNDLIKIVLLEKAYSQSYETAFWFGNKRTSLAIKLKVTDLLLDLKRDEYLMPAHELNVQKLNHVHQRIEELKNTSSTFLLFELVSQLLMLKQNLDIFGRRFIPLPANYDPSDYEFDLKNVAKQAIRLKTWLEHEGEELPFAEGVKRSTIRKPPSLTDNDVRLLSTLNKPEERARWLARLSPEYANLLATYTQVAGEENMLQMAEADIQGFLKNYRDEKKSKRLWSRLVQKMRR